MDFYPILMVNWCGPNRWDPCILGDNQVFGSDKYILSNIYFHIFNIFIIIIDIINILKENCNSIENLTCNPAASWTCNPAAS